MMIMKKKLLMLVGLFCLFFFVFLRIAFYCSSDIHAHALFATLRIEDGHMFSGNFLLYFLLNVVSGFSSDVGKVMVADCFLLAMAVVLKYIIISRYFTNNYGAVFSGLLSFSLLFVYIIPLVMPGEYYLGYRPLRFYLNYFVPNVWHNSTIIFSMPFAILTYMYSLKLLTQFSMKDCLKVSLVSVICVMIKPSFFFAFSCPYTLLVLWKYYHEKQKLLALLVPVFLCIVGVVYQYMTIYDTSDGSSVIFSLNRMFSVDYWKLRWPYYISSFVFPAIYPILNYRKCIHDVEFILVYSMLMISILIWLLFEETGLRAGHGNLGWQIIPSMWFVYFYIVRRELTVIADFSFNYLSIPIRHKLVIGSYLLMVVTGIIYLAKYLYFGHYV